MALLADHQQHPSPADDRPLPPAVLASVLMLALSPAYRQSLLMRHTNACNFAGVPTGFLNKSFDCLPGQVAGISDTVLQAPWMCKTLLRVWHVSPQRRLCPLCRHFGHKYCFSTGKTLPQPRLCLSTGTLGMDVDKSFETEADGTVTLRPGTGGNFKGTLKPGAATPGLLMNF